MEYLAPIISAIGSILIGWFAYNQHTRDKMTDLKIENSKKEIERKENGRSMNTARVYYEISQLLWKLKADRVYIIQPHPLGHEAYISVQFECTRSEICPIKPSIQSVEMKYCAHFVKTLAEEEFLFITDVGHQLEDRVMRSILSANGGKTIAIRRMLGKDDWVGNIVVELCDDDTVLDQEVAACAMNEAAINIQLTLPEFRELKIK